MTAQNKPPSELAALAGKALLEFDAVCQGYREQDGDLAGFSIRCPKARGGEYLITIRGLDDAGAPVVAFHTADSLNGLWASLWVRYKNGDLKWKEDTWAKK